MFSFPSMWLRCSSYKLTISDAAIDGLKFMCEDKVCLGFMCYERTFEHLKCPLMIY